MPGAVPTEVKQAAPSWEGIENPAAREMARVLKKTCGKWLIPEEIGGAQAGQDLSVGYRKWLRESLRHSGFFSKLDGGMNGLPDIREAVPALLKPAESLYYPRNFRAMVPHFARNLEWYLRPESKPRLPALFALQVFLLLASLGVLIGAIFGFISPQSAVLVLLRVGLPLALMLYIGAQGSLLVGEPRGSAKYKINAAELYRYLLDLHTEDDQTESPA